MIHCHRAVLALLHRGRVLSSRETTRNSNLPSMRSTSEPKLVDLQEHPAWPVLLLTTRSAGKSTITEPL
jgi:hypothetical protein